jgi:hypothetical protein
MEGRATLGAARLENGHSFDRPEIKTDRASHTQAKGDLEQNGRLVELGLKANGMTEKSQSRTLTVGDRVKLVPNLLPGEAEMTLQDQIGEVIERRDDGRVTVRFDNGRLLMAREPKSFEWVSGLTAKGK